MFRFDFCPETHHRRSTIFAFPFLRSRQRFPMKRCPRWEDAKCVPNRMQDDNKQNRESVASVESNRQVMIGDAERRFYSLHCFHFCKFIFLYCACVFYPGTRNDFLLLRRTLQSNVNARSHARARTQAQPLRQRRRARANERRPNFRYFMMY